MIIYNPQPIKCVEAVFLALYLTAGISDAERISLGFKSELHGQIHQHIVLLVRHNSKYGAFGISRQHNLMNKDFNFESISSIVDDYRKAYEQSQHKVLRIRVGLPVEHNVESFNFVCWRHLSLDPSSSLWEQCSEALETHVTQSKRLWERWLLDGQRENKTADMFLKNIEMKPMTGAHDSSSRKQLSRCSLEASRFKSVKRRQEPDKQEPAFKLVKRRQALREIRSFGNMSNEPLTSKITAKSTSKMKKVPSSPRRKSPRELAFSARRCSRCQSLSDGSFVTGPISATTHKKNTKKMALKCYSLELFSGSCRMLGLHMDEKKPKMNPHQAKKGRSSSKGNFRKTEVSGFPSEFLSSWKPTIKRTAAVT